MGFLGLTREATGATIRVTRPNWGRNSVSLPNMRTLVLSDIHENIVSVRRMRECESDVYDAIIVAGDIGNEIAEEFYAVLDSFNCPVFCVYGNWDNDLPYKRKLSKNCILLHQSVERVKGFFITGFSGCPTSWGRNPIHLAKKKALSHKHRGVLSRIERASQRLEEQTQEIVARYAIELEELSKATKDRRRKSYKRRVAKIEERKRSDISTAQIGVTKIYGSRAYSAYQSDELAITDDTLLCNRNALFDLIRASNFPQDRLIIITHERMFRISDEGIVPLLHVFGHIHKYAFSLFKGTHYLNAAAIDNGYSAAFGRKNLLPEGYCDVEISGGQVTVVRRLLGPSQKCAEG